MNAATVARAVAKRAKPSARWENKLLFAQGIKRCETCRAIKPTSEYYPNPSKPYGLCKECKSCNRRRVNAYRKRHLERCRERLRAYYAAHGERLRALNSAYQKAHRERLADQHAAYHQAHREEIIARVRAWAAAHPDRVRRISRIAGHRHRARKRAVGGSYTADEWEGLCAAAGQVCLCCGRARPLTADHIVPLSKGGCNAISNIQPLCRPCNSAKGVKSTDYRPTASQR